jgi:hypothetical protein
VLRISLLRLNSVYKGMYILKRLFTTFYDQPVVYRPNVAAIPPFEEVCKSFDWQSLANFTLVRTDSSDAILAFKHSSVSLTCRCNYQALVTIPKYVTTYDCNNRMMDALVTPVCP